MQYVPDEMVLAKLQALPQHDKDFILGLIDARIARAAKTRLPLRLIVSRNSSGLNDDFLRRG